MQEDRIERLIMRPKGNLLPTQNDELLAFQLKEFIVQKHDVDRGNKKMMVDAIVELRDVKRWEAYKILQRLWRCGLVTRMGVIDSRSEQPCHQLWIL